MTLVKNTPPNDGVAEYSVLRVTPDGSEQVCETVVREYPLTIILNNQELVTLLCYPDDMKNLVVGFLASEGFLESKAEIRRITVDDVRGVVRVTTTSRDEVDPGVIFKRVISSGCGRGAAFYSAAHAASLEVKSDMTVPAVKIAALARKFQQSSSIYLSTHGVHSAALCDEDEILVFCEDIGRHNAIDKIFGKCLMEGISTEEKFILTSGRVTSEILHKVARRKIPVLVSISAPTNLGVEISETLGITLVASARGKKMSIYTHGRRVLV